MTTRRGLNLPGPMVGVGEEEEEAVHGYWNTYESVVQGLESQGISPLLAPEYQCPRVNPEILNSPDSQGYIDTYSKVNAWYGFVSQALAHVECVMLEQKSEMNDIETRIRRRMRKTESPRTTARGTPKPFSEKEMEDAISQDRRYRELKRDHQKSTQEYKLLRGRKEELERDVALMSRVVEIRRQERDISNSDHNMPRRVRGQPSPAQMGGRYRRGGMVRV